MTTKLARHTESVDMSPEAIQKRLKDVSDLRRLGVAIEKARRVGPVGKRQSPAGETDNVQS